MNIAAALKQMRKQIQEEDLEVHYYTLFRGQVGVVLLSHKTLPSRPILARGIAIQNPLDPPSPKIRSFWALRRALHAYKTRVNSEPINPVSLGAADYAYRTFKTKGPVYKSQYAPVLPKEGYAHDAEYEVLERIKMEAVGE